MITVHCPRCGMAVESLVAIGSVDTTGEWLKVHWQPSDIWHRCELPPDPTRDKVAR